MWMLIITRREKIITKCGDYSCLEMFEFWNASSPFEGFNTSCWKERISKLCYCDWICRFSCTDFWEKREWRDASTFSIFRVIKMMLFLTNIFWPLQIYDQPRKNNLFVNGFMSSALLNYMEEREIRFNFIDDYHTCYPHFEEAERKTQRKQK